MNFFTPVTTCIPIFSQNLDISSLVEQDSPNEDSANTFNSSISPNPTDTESDSGSDTLSDPNPTLETQSPILNTDEFPTLMQSFHPELLPHNLKPKTPLGKTIYTKYPCKHGRAHHGYYCKLCKENGTNGRGLCEHNNQKRQCPHPLCIQEKLNLIRKKTTTPCVHGKCNEGRFCLQCKRLGIGGRGLCEHDRIKYHCRNEACRTLRFKNPSNPRKRCKHGSSEKGYYCLSCWHEGVRGKGICDHGKDYRMCKFLSCQKKKVFRLNSKSTLTVANLRCPHGRGMKGQFCRQCHDSGSTIFLAQGICEHSKQIYECPTCTKIPYCEHGKKRSRSCKHCWDMGVLNRGICRHRKLSPSCDHETCRNFVLSKLKAKSWNLVDDFLQGLLDHWNTEQRNSQPDWADVTLKECELLYVKPLILFHPNEIHFGHVYTNIQPVPPSLSHLFTTWTPEDDRFWYENIYGKMDRKFIYIPGQTYKGV